MKMRGTFWILQVLLLQVVKFTCSEVQDDGSDSIENFTNGNLASSCDCELHGQEQLCQSTGRVQIPQICSLNVTRVRIEGSNITELRVGDFVGYENVLDMKLDHNKISFIENGTFRTLKRLVNLSISFNPLKQLEVECFTGLESLELLQLTNNKFVSFHDIVPSLTPLFELKTLKLDNNLFDHMNGDDFIQLSNSSIEVLSLGSCALEQIHPNALKPLKRLTDLNLSKNTMNETNFIELMSNMKDSNLTKVDLSRLCFSFDNILPDLMGVLSDSHVSHLSLQNNVIPQLKSTSFVEMPNLRHLDLSHCEIKNIENGTFDTLINLISLNLSANSINGVPIAVLSLSKLERFDFSSNCGSSSDSGMLELSDNLFSQMTALIYLDLSSNRVQMSPNSFYGLGNLQELRLSNCFISRMADNWFQPLSALRLLRLNGNKLDHQNFTVHTFDGLGSLEYLNMDDCKISQLSQSLFKSTPNLTHLSLTNNKIRVWNSRLFGTSPMLRTLNLDGNQIKTITKAMSEDFANLSVVNLLDNPIECNCNLKNLSHLFPRNVIQAGNCSSPDILSNTSISQFVLFDNQTNCEDVHKSAAKFLPLYVSIPSVALIISIAAVAYFFRSYIRFCIFRCRAPKTTIPAPTDGERQYDAFVSYSIEDGHFVEQMVQMLENQSPQFKLCVFERDFTAGTVLNDCILQSIAVSRKVILIISKHFVRSQWCLWELHLAQNYLLEENRDDVILVVVDKPRVASLPPTLRCLLRTHIYLKWNPDPLKQPLFWDKLRTALCRSKEGRPSYLERNVV